MLHYGHVNLLRQARALGDYLIVGVTSDNFDIERGKLNVQHNVLNRIQAIKESGLADEIIIEDYVGQKIDDVQRYNVDIFAIGSDWCGKFDYLKEYCDVVYIPRTDGISSSLLREQRQVIHKIGIVGAGRIAQKFVKESTVVNGLDITALYEVAPSQIEKFSHVLDLENSYPSWSSFLEKVDAVYIATPHLSHYNYIKKCLRAGKHVLCEIPLTLNKKEAIDVYELAERNNLVLLEAAKTAFSPAFLHLTSLVKSGMIGEVVNIEASLSKLQDRSLREFDEKQAGGAMTELGALPLLAIVKLLGLDLQSKHFYAQIEQGVDVFTKGVFIYDKAIASITLGLGVKTEGSLVVSGTKGYVYVPAPWWKTEYFEIRFEDQNMNRKFFYPFLGEGLRYEIQEFVSMINNRRLTSFKLKTKESVFIAGVMEDFLCRRGFTILNK